MPNNDEVQNDNTMTFYKRKQDFNLSATSKSLSDFLNPVSQINIGGDDEEE